MPTAAPSRNLQPTTWIHLVGLFLIGAALCISPLKMTGGFFSDEAVYYSMAYSFAYDSDMEFQRKDLLRVYHEYPAGPTGIILKLNERDNTIVYGKSFLYSLVSAPFVRLFQTNGFLVLHAVLVWLNLLCAYRFCSSFMQEGSALLFSGFYFLANASLVYYFWMTPEYFNMSLLCFALFFFTAERLKSSFLLFRSPYNYFVAAILFGLVTYSKPPNALLVLPLGVWLLLRKKPAGQKGPALVQALLTLVLYIFTTVALFGLNVYFTGHWNYQGGKRAAFYKSYPFERPGVSEFAAFEKRDPIEAMVAPPFYWKTFLYNWCYFFFGRYSGIAIYFFPMFFCLLFYLFGPKTRFTWAVYLAAWIGILYYMVGLPWNYFGGSGTVGNRYVLSVFPAFLFSLNKEPSRRLMVFAFLVSALFTGALLFSPILSSHRNAFHQQFSIFRLLPVENSLLSDLPLVASFRARRVAFDNPSNYFTYFMDDHTYYKEGFEGATGFWVKGGKSAEFVLRVFRPEKTLRVQAWSLIPSNKVTVHVNGKGTEFFFNQTGRQTKEIALPDSFPYDRDGTGATYLFNVRIKSESGTLATIGGYEERYLGAFIRLDVQ
jgi:hypothetical protein